MGCSSSLWWSSIRWNKCIEQDRCETLWLTGAHPSSATPSNFKLNWNMFVYISIYVSQIIAKFCKYQNNSAVLVCAIFCCDQIGFPGNRAWLFALKLECGGNILSQTCTRSMPHNQCLGYEALTRSNKVWSIVIIKILVIVFIIIGYIDYTILLKVT